MAFNGFDTKRDIMRFHMPGHSGSDLGITSLDDITELSYSGNLIESLGTVSEIERDVAKLYGAKYALLFTSGATSAINATLLAVKQMLLSPKIIISGNTHKSLYSYANIHGLPLMNSDDYSETPEDNCVFFHTSPDYYGRYTSLKNSHHAKIKVIDASHASHYVLSAELPDITLKDYDIIIYSLHKTLPVLTGGALIVTDNDEYYQHLLLARMRTHTTSPSFMTLASIGNAIKAVNANGQAEYIELKKIVDEFIKHSPFKAYYYDDFTRLIVDLNGLDANVLNSYLETNGCYVEMIDRDKLVLIVTPYNAKYLNNLLSLLYNSPMMDNAKISVETTTFNPEIVKNHTKIGTISFIELDCAVGEISANDIGIYPPGTPIITSGQIFSSEIIEYIKSNYDRVFGLINGKVAIYNRK